MRKLKGTPGSDESKSWRFLVLVAPDSSWSNWSNTLKYFNISSSF